MVTAFSGIFVTSICIFISASVGVRLPSDHSIVSTDYAYEGKESASNNYLEGPSPSSVCSSANPAKIPTGVPPMPSMWWSNDLKSGAQVQLRTSTENWLGPIDGNNWESGIWAGLHKVSADIFFTVVCLGEAHISLRAVGGFHLTYANGSVTLSKPRNNGPLDADSVFRIRQGGESQVQLQAQSGQWLSAGSEGALSWASTTSSAETFDVREVKQVAAIRGVNLGGWLIIEGWMTPYLFADVPAFIDGAQIQIYSASQQCHASADWAGGGAVSCKAVQEPGAWETFRVRRDSPVGPNGGLLLRTANQNYCTSTLDPEPLLAATVEREPAADGPETFYLVHHPSDSSLVYIKGQNGQYLEVRPGGDLAFSCSQPSWEGASAFRITQTGALQGEWQLGAGLGSVKASELLEQHRSTFIVEEDFASIAKMNINFLRIPVGYWITQGEEADGSLVPGGIQHLDRAMDLAQKYELRVLIDLHGAPGSQNGNQESGSRDGIAAFSYDANLQQHLDAIEWLAARYAAHPAFFGLELLNEPGANLNLYSVMYKLYEEGYKRIRKHSACAYVVFNTPVILEDTAMKNVLNGSSYTNVIQDVHWYWWYYFGKDVSTVLNETVTQTKELLYNLIDDPKEEGRLVMVGEWSLGLPMNKHYSDQEYLEFAESQLAVFGEATAGWVFWSYKNDVDYYEPNYAAWSFQRSWAKGWFNGTY